MLPSKTIFFPLWLPKAVFSFKYSSSVVLCCQYLSYVNSTVIFEYTTYICSQCFLPKISFFLSYSFCAPCFLLFESKSQNCSQTCPPSLTHTDGSSQTVKQFPHVNSIPERSTKSSFWWLNTLKKQKTMSPYTFLRRKLSNNVGRSSYGF